MLVVANWKMNGLRRESIDRAKTLAQMESTNRLKCDVLLCPPAQILSDIRYAIDNSNIFLGAQDCHFDFEGPYTGDISSSMLVDVGCTHVIIGHSERRINHSETNEIVARKAEAAHQVGLNTIICIGENMEEFKLGQTVEKLSNQLANSIPDSANLNNTMIAYEPCWAIGSGSTPTLTEIDDTHKAILEFTKNNIFKQGEKIDILYGGSVNEKNADSILDLDHVGGVLVGGASLITEKFWSICKSADRKFK